MINPGKIDFNNLSPEILEQLNNIDDIDLARIKASYDNIPGDNTNNSSPIIDDPERPGKLIQCTHEIVFTVTARVLEENLKGEIVGEKEVSIKTYHIPVPIDKDYKNYMTTFFKYLEDKMIETIDHSNETSKEKEI
jgi:hypothetical protein